MMNQKRVIKPEQTKQVNDLSMKTTEEKVIEIIRSVKEIQHPITPEMSLTNDLYFDSLDMLMVINAIEADFSYKVDMGEVDKIKTVGDIIQALNDSTQKS